MMSARGLVLTVAVAGCGSGGGFPDAPPIDSPPPLGTFSLAWSVTDTTGTGITCDQIGAQTVTALVRNRGVQGGSTEVFTCGTLMGTSQGVVAGTYDIGFELTGMGGDPATGLIATAQKQQGIVVKPGENTPLAPLTFAVDAKGGLKLNLSTNKPGGNCGATAAMGAGITGVSITLLHTGPGTCEPVTFAIAAGASRPAGSYTVNCAMPTLAPCIDADQQLSVTGVPSGAYQIHVRGKVGAADCWTNDDALPVPPLGRDLTRTLNLGFGAATPGC